MRLFSRRLIGKKYLTLLALVLTSMSEPTLANDEADRLLKTFIDYMDRASGCEVHSGSSSIKVPWSKITAIPGDKNLIRGKIELPNGEVKFIETTVSKSRFTKAEKKSKNWVTNKVENGTEFAARFFLRIKYQGELAIAAAEKSGNAKLAKRLTQIYELLEPGDIVTKDANIVSIAYFNPDPNHSELGFVVDGLEKLGPFDSVTQFDDSIIPNRKHIFPHNGTFNISFDSTTIGDTKIERHTATLIANGKNMRYPGVPGSPTLNINWSDVFKAIDAPINFDLNQSKALRRYGYQPGKGMTTFSDDVPYIRIRLSDNPEYAKLFTFEHPIANAINDITLYEITNPPVIAATKENIDATLPALEHPFFKSYFDKLKQKGYRVVIDPTLQLVRTDGVHNSATRIIRINPGSSWAVFVHEYGHMLFSEAGLKNNYTSFLTSKGESRVKDFFSGDNLKKLKEAGLDIDSLLLSIKKELPTIAANEAHSVSLEFETLKKYRTKILPKLGFAALDSHQLGAKLYALDWEIQEITAIPDLKRTHAQNMALQNAIVKRTALKLAVEVASWLSPAAAGTAIGLGLVYSGTAAFNLGREYQRKEEREKRGNIIYYREATGDFVVIDSSKEMHIINISELRANAEFMDQISIIQKQYPSH